MKGTVEAGRQMSIEARKCSRSLFLSSGLATVSTMIVSFTVENFSVALKSIQATFKKIIQFLTVVCVYLFYLNRPF